MIFDLLAVFGLAWVIADSKLTMPARTRLAEHVGETSLVLALFECPPCLSFWIGLTVKIAFGANLLDSIVFAFAAVGASILAWSFVKR